MVALFVRYLDLVLMRLPPQAFPASRFLFGVTLLAFLLTMLASNFLLSGEWAYSLVRALLSVFNLCAAALLVLLFAGRSARWQQTATALLGGETVIGLIVLPILLAQSMGMENIFILTSIILFMIWELVFLAHVFGNALDTGMGTGMLVAVIYVIASVVIKQQVMPFPTAQ